MRRLLMLAFAFLMLLTLKPIPVHAADLIVNNSGDDPDIDPGDGSCETALGFCTMRAAIEEANALLGPDIIEYFPSGGTLVQTFGEIAITDDVTITTTSVTIGPSLPGRVFSMTDVTVVIDGLAMLGGNASSGDEGNNGGGIYANGTNLTLQNGASVRGNFAATYGGGIFATNGAKITITGSTTRIANNNSGFGGGLYLEEGSTANISGGATVEGNSAVFAGGGVFLSSGTSLMLNASSITDNESDAGGGSLFPVRNSLFRMGQRSRIIALISAAAASWVRAIQ